MRRNHHEKLRLKRISCATQFIIPKMAGTCPDPACNITDMWSSQPNQASCPPDCSYLLISSTSYSSSSPIPLFLGYNCTLIAEHKVKLSLSISPCHAHESTPNTAYIGYKHTPITAYTKYTIHQVHHIPSTAYTIVQHTAK
jgi:hypothetical protein